MNCIKCYQEIPEGSKFCPHCGAAQTPVPEAGTADTQAQPEAGAQDNAYGQMAGTGAQPETNTQYQESRQSNYQNGQQNNYQNGWQNNYQNGNYQTPYQQDQGEPVNWVPYLVLSIISTLCCCIPGIVAIVFSVKINSAVNAGNTEEARRAAKTAKIWIIAAFVLGILASIISFIIMGMVGESAYYYYYY